jgi:hypothetical protein
MTINHTQQLKHPYQTNMKIKIIKLDPTGVEEEIVNISNIDIKLAPDYHRFLVEIDGISYMLTKNDAFFIYPTN